MRRADPQIRSPRPLSTNYAGGPSEVLQIASTIGRLARLPKLSTSVSSGELRSNPAKSVTIWRSDVDRFEPIAVLGDRVHSGRWQAWLGLDIKRLAQDNRRCTMYDVLRARSASAEHGEEHADFNLYDIRPHYLWPPPRSRNNRRGRHRHPAHGMRFSGAWTSRSKIGDAPGQCAWLTQRAVLSCPWNRRA